MDLRERAKTTSVLIRVNCPVARGRSALSRTMSPSAGEYFDKGVFKNLL